MNGKREQGRVGWFKHPSASPSGRRRVWGCDTRAFSPGFNMAGLRPCRTGVNVTAGEAVGAGKSWGPSGRASWRTLGGVRKGGRVMGKRTGFSHVFPEVSMQVVDFPRLAVVRHFLDANLASQARHEMGAQVGLFARAKRGRE